MSIDVIARASRERASDRGVVARRLLGELRPYKRRLALALVFIVAGALAQAAGPWLISRAIDQEILQGDETGLAWTMLLLLATYVGGMLAARGQIFVVGGTGQRILAGLRARLFDQFQRLPLDYFDRRPIGDLISRSTNDVDTINQFIGQGVTQLLGAMFSLIGIVFAMLLLEWKLALACYLIIPIMLLTTSAFAGRARDAFRRARETTGDVSATLQEEIVGVREAQAFGRTDRNIAEFRQRNAANRDANVQATAITSGFAPAMDVLSTLATALVIGFGSYLVFRDELTVGVVAAFLIYVQQFFRPVQLASQVYTQAQAALAGGERIYQILDEPREPEEPPQTPELPPIAGRIAFDRVTFAYVPGQPALHDVSFAVEPGQRVALVGPTGAGKTTIANLIPRFYDVTAGAVRVDGRDVRQVTRSSLRRQIATVLQEPFLFQGTVAENIGYGREDATREEIEAAARAVDAHGFILRLPDGYDTRLGEGGGGLSEGQRQLLSFARAILAEPRILILDEATSRIDTRTEATIQAALRTLLSGRTSVTIAHRLSTIRDSDLILMIDRGRIVERGDHASLLAQGGLYAALSRRQFRDALPPEAEGAPTEPAVTADG
jgi:ATP-binding cassette subfamily B protein/subfamily B ATP-binding cassette protein MsbA